MGNWYFISEYNAADPRARSGVPYHIVQGSARLPQSLNPIQASDGRNIWEKIASRFLQTWYKHLLKNKQGWYDARLSKAYSRGYARSLRGFHFTAWDTILSISPAVVAMLPPGPKVVLWIDNTFDTYGMYPGREAICQQSCAEARMMEKKAFDRATLIFTASTWLANILMKTYKVPGFKIQVMPRGANLIYWPHNAEIENWIQQRCAAPTLQLLMVNSGNWKVGRKGGPLVVDTYKKLKNKIPVRLTVVGALSADIQNELEDAGIICTGRLNFNEPEGANRYRQLMASAHFLFVPSKADGFGIVYAEAAAHGLPSVAKAIMGVTEAVKPHVTGLLLTPEASSEDFAAAIMQQWQHKSAYADLCTSAYQYATQHFQWATNLFRIMDEPDKIEANFHMHF